jgi:hypothetical protein
MSTMDTGQSGPNNPPEGQKLKLKYSPEELSVREEDRKARAREWLLKEKAKVS